MSESPKKIFCQTMNSFFHICIILASVSSSSLARLEFPERFAESGDLGPILQPFTSDDLARYLEALSGQNQQDELMFPSLDTEQKRFAVNPSYAEFHADVFGQPPSEDSGEENEEVVDNEPISNDDMLTYLYPKKASMKALMNEDPRVLASVIEDDRINDIYFTTIVGVASGLTVFLIVGAGFLFHRARKNAKAAEEVEYPAYGVTGPGKEISPTSGDRKLAQNAQLYHYQHQKQQMIAFDSNTGNERQNGAVSDNESEDGEEGDYTVYECPGLAPTGEMEVRNPMFEDDATPKATK